MLCSSLVELPELIGFSNQSFLFYPRIQEFIIGLCLQVMLGVNFLIHHIKVSFSKCQGLSKGCGMLLQVLIKMDL